MYRTSVILAMMFCMVLELCPLFENGNFCGFHVLALFHSPAESYCLVHRHAFYFNISWKHLYCMGTFFLMFYGDFYMFCNALHWCSRYSGCLE